MVEQTLSYEQYLASLPQDRRPEVDKLWRIVRENMPDGYVEEVGEKFLSFKADGDWYVAMANQKNYISLYLIPVYVFPELKAKLDRAGKNLKCGKSCINFKRADDLPLDVIAEIIGANDYGAFKEHVRAVRGGGGKKEKVGKRRTG